jgi:hypothetical protein
MVSPKLADEVPGHVDQAASNRQTEQSRKNPDDSESPESLENQTSYLVMFALHLFHSFFVSMVKTNGSLVHVASPYG